MELKFKTIREGYPSLIQTLFKDGKMRLDKTRESKEERFTKDLHNIMIVIEEPGFEQMPDGFLYNKTYMKEYAKQLMNPKNETGFVYTYGGRLRSYPFENVYSSQFLKPDNLYSTDQISYVIKSLRKNNQTRRAITTTLFPPLDNFQSDIPCMQLTDFKTIDKELHLTVYFRSQDLMALPLNLYGLNELLNYVAKEVNLRSGTITVFDSSLHAYQRDWKYLLRLAYKDLEYVFVYAQTTYESYLLEKEVRP